MVLTPAQKTRLRAQGYLVLRGLAPASRVAAASKVVAGVHDASQLEGARAHPAVLGLLFETPLWALAQGLCAEALERPASAQLAIRPARESAPARPLPHVDGMPGAPSVEEEYRRSSFTLTLGVLLDDIPTPGFGNPVVYPGSHQRIADHFKTRPLVSLREGLPPELAVGTPKPLTGKRGDVLLYHHQLVHDRLLNESPRPLCVVFFRLRARGHESRALESLKDPWQEWPGLGILLG